MAAVPWLEDVQETLVDQYGEDMITVDSTCSTNFTFAIREEERSLDKIAIPMFLGGVAGKRSFTGLDQPGPALLGMDYMRGMGWCIDFETGRCVIRKLKQHFVLPCTAGRYFLPLRCSDSGQAELGRSEAISSAQHLEDPIVTEAYESPVRVHMNRSLCASSGIVASASSSHDIRITFQQPCQQNTVNLSPGSGLGATFGALNGRPLHVPARQDTIKILVPWHPIKPEANAFNPDNTDIWVANGISLPVASPQAEQATSSTPGGPSEKQRRAEKLRDGATSSRQHMLPSKTSSSFIPRNETFMSRSETSKERPKSPTRR